MFGFQSVGLLLNLIFSVGSGLLVRATYLVCHRLISSWKSDLIVSLAALELLAGLARLHNTRAGK